MSQIVGSDQRMAQNQLPKLAIVGLGGQSRIVAETAKLSGWGSVHHFREPKLGLYKNVPDDRGCGDFQRLLDQKHKYDSVFVGIGNNSRRIEIIQKLQVEGCNLATLIHPAAFISPSATIGEGSIVCAGAIIQVGCSIGVGCIINTASSIDHDSKVGTGVHISPGAHIAGEAMIKDYAWIGVGAALIQQIEIGQNSIVGAGSCVLKNVAENVTVAGVPARIIRKSYADEK